jgi:hypothetical protein
VNVSAGDSSNSTFPVLAGQLAEQLAASSEQPESLPGIDLKSPIPAGVVLTPPADFYCNVAPATPSYKI